MISTRAALYARVSTHNGQDPEMQLRELREYCARRGWIIAGEYVDGGISGTKEHRRSWTEWLWPVASDRWMLWWCTDTTALPAAYGSW